VEYCQKSPNGKQLRDVFSLSLYYPPYTLYGKKCYGNEDSSAMATSQLAEILTIMGI
jgi:hypothetical protein